MVIFDGGLQSLESVTNFNEADLRDLPSLMSLRSLTPSKTFFDKTLFLAKTLFYIINAAEYQMQGRNMWERVFLSSPVCRVTYMNLVGHSGKCWFRWPWSDPAWLFSWLLQPSKSVIPEQASRPQFPPFK